MGTETLLAPDLLFAGLALCVVIAVTTEAAIGFGSILIALTLGANLYPISTVLPLMVCVSVMLTSYIVARHHAHVAWAVLLQRILPGMGLGMIGGYTLFVSSSDALLERLLGVFVLCVTVVEFRRLRAASTAAATGISNAAFTATTIGAGIVHGMTATGGPVLVYALGRLGMTKGEFRSTLACVWLTLNGTLVVTYWTDGRLGAHNAPFVLALAPVVAVSIALGEWLHGRLDESMFRRIVLSILSLAGLSLIV